ncbi:PRC-barrel domain-containing protein [Aquihabitans sp. G128]|uniref:PRC-barrel domain-containing protein n=1 Tax=Aquihabitans sp. G128 TaxID=2849779 RepID=UPI001C213811|nr:PRC-barrel domain-containing protein [Aquihabitans sp. G128]QXC60857.1 PRC-barrel domain-containing protein [Aquihabitans sp. G128]
MIGLSTLRHLDVLDTSAAARVGRVDAPIVDATKHRVTGLLVGGVEDGAVVLPWDAVVGFGPDAVTVAGADGRRRPEDDLERRAVEGGPTLIAARVLSDAGDLLGTVHEVRVKPSGIIAEVDLGDRVVPGTAIVGLGHHALVVRADA